MLCYTPVLQHFVVGLTLLCLCGGHTTSKITSTLRFRNVNVNVANRSHLLYVNKGRWRTSYSWMYLLSLFRPRIDMRLNCPCSLTFLHAGSAAYVGVVARSQGYFSNSSRMSAQMSISFLSHLALGILPLVAIAHVFACADPKRHLRIPSP